MNQEEIVEGNRFVNVPIVYGDFVVRVWALISGPWHDRLSAMVDGSKKTREIHLVSAKNVIGQHANPSDPYKPDVIIWKKIRLFSAPDNNIIDAWMVNDGIIPSDIDMRNKKDDGDPLPNHLFHSLKIGGPGETD